MKPYKVSRLHQMFRQMLVIKSKIIGGGNRLFDNYLQSNKLLQLTSTQREDAISYWQKRAGLKVDLRWHQLLYSLTGIYTPRYMPFDVYEKIIASQMPPRSVSSYFDDKNLYRHFLHDFTIPQRVVECYNGIFYLPEVSNIETTKEKVLSYCSSIANCIIKPSKGTSAGSGVTLLNVSNCIANDGRSLEDIFSSYKFNFVIERKIETSDNLKTLNSSSCNTIRIHTYRSSVYQDIEFISAYIRIGRNGKVIDNASAGGITCQVTADGVLGDFPCTVNPYQKVVATDSGVLLAGYKIEKFDKMVETAIRAHSNIPLFGIIGWDVTMNKNGEVVIIEFNPDPDLRIEQLVFRDTCLLDKQDEILKEVFT